MDEGNAKGKRQAFRMCPSPAREDGGGKREKTFPLKATIAHGEGKKQPPVFSFLLSREPREKNGEGERIVLTKKASRTMRERKKKGKKKEAMNITLLPSYSPMGGGGGGRKKGVKESNGLGIHPKATMYFARGGATRFIFSPSEQRGGEKFSWGEKGNHAFTAMEGKGESEAVFKSLRSRKGKEDHRKMNLMDECC